MKTISFAALILICTPCFAQRNGRNVPPRARFEVRERGDHVEHVVPRAVGQLPNAPPINDSHKWYFTLISTSSCPTCARLTFDLANSEFLKPYVDIKDYKNSWMHYNSYLADDETTNWRWAKIRIQGYPTVLIQPPRNGLYGESKTVVLQITGYDGDAEKFAQQIRDGILRYVARLHVRSMEAAIPAAAIAPPEAATTAEPSIFEQRPPFIVPLPDQRIEPTPAPQPTVLPQIVPPEVQPTPRPQQQPQVGIDLGSLLAWLLGSILQGQGTTNVLIIGMLIVLGMRAYRAYRKATGKQTLMSDEDFARLVIELERAFKLRANGNGIVK